MVDTSAEVVRRSCSSPDPTPITENKRAGCQVSASASLNSGSGAFFGTGFAVRTPRGRAGFGMGVAGVAGTGGVAGSWTAGSSAVVASKTMGGTAGVGGAVGSSSISIAAVMHSSVSVSVPSVALSSPTSTPKSSANPASPDDQPCPIARSFQSPFLR